MLRSSWPARANGPGSNLRYGLFTLCYGLFTLWIIHIMLRIIYTLLWIIYGLFTLRIIYDTDFLLSLSQDWVLPETFLVGRDVIFILVILVLAVYCIAAFYIFSHVPF